MRTFLLSLLLLGVPAARAGDISPDQIRDAFCRYFKTRDLEEAFRPLTPLRSARLSTSSKPRTADRPFTVQTTTLKTDDWSATYSYQQKGNDRYGYELEVYTSDAERGMIFSSVGEVREWLGQYGTVTVDEDDESYSVGLGGEWVVLTAKFADTSQAIYIEWLQEQHEVTARSICR